MLNSEGQKSSPDATKEHLLPCGITSIDIYFQKNEKRFHSMVFRGLSDLQIGRTPELDQKWWQGNWLGHRKETFNVPAG